MAIIVVQKHKQAKYIDWKILRNTNLCQFELQYDKQAKYIAWKYLWNLNILQSSNFKTQKDRICWLKVFRKHKQLANTQLLKLNYRRFPPIIQC